MQYLCYSCKELLLVDVFRIPGLLLTSFMRCLISLFFCFFQPDFHNKSTLSSSDLLRSNMRDDALECSYGTTWTSGKFWIGGQIGQIA